MAQTRAARVLWPIVLGSLLCAVGVLYLRDLEHAPPHLSIEEAATIYQSVSLATTGRDLDGRWFPMYFNEPGNRAGRDPLWVYAGALLLRMAPFSQALMRLPSVVAGLACIAIVYFVGRRLGGSRQAGLVAAAILAFAPAHFIQSRIATQQIGLVLFVLLWLLFLLRYFATARRRELFAAGIALGLAVYSYVAALALVPGYFAAMALAVGRRGAGPSLADHSWRGTPLAAACAGFGLALMPLVAWHLWYPERIVELVDYYTQHGYNEDLHSETLGARAFATRLNTWWDTFNPERFFATGDSDPRFSTRSVGYFLTPVAVFVVVGVPELWKQLAPAVRRLLVAVILWAPMAAVVANANDVKRWMSVIPVFALLAMLGILRMLRSGSSRVRGLVAVLVALAVLQFADFNRYYHQRYGASAVFFFRGNTKAAVAEVLTAGVSPGCAFHDHNVIISTYWELYMTLSGRDDFARHRNAIDINDLGFAPPLECERSSVIVTAASVLNNAALRERLDQTGWLARPIPEPDGTTFLVVYHRTGR